MENKSFTSSMAILSGISLLLMAIIAGYAFGFAFSSFYFQDNATQTFLLLKSQPDLLRYAIVGFIFILLLDLLLSWSLKEYFLPFDKSIASFIGITRVVYTALFGIAIAHLVGALQLLNGSTDATLVYRELQLFVDCWNFSLLTFGIHLGVVGILFLNNSELPSYLGYLLLLAAACYLGSNLTYFISSDYAAVKASWEAILAIPMAAGELTLAFWLLIKGRKIIH